MLKKEAFQYCVTNASIQHIGYAVHKGQIQLVYEEQDGSFVLVSESQDSFCKETLFYSKTGAFHNRMISLELKKGEPYVFFSARYKDKNLILLYNRQQMVHIFDFCDKKNFQTLLRENGEIVILYEKRGVVGFSTLSDDVYSKFEKLNVANPVKLFEWNRSLYLLSQEEQFFLTHIEEKKVYPLPLVYHRKPYLQWESDGLYVFYRFYHKNIIYKLENEKIIFLREEY